MSEFSELKARYIALANKNPPPMGADALRAKVAELEAAAAEAASQSGSAPIADAGVPPAEAKAAEDVARPQAGERNVDHEGSAASEPQVDHGANPDAVEAPADVSIEGQLGELGLKVNADGDVELEMLVGFSGPEINVGPGDEHRCGAAEAVRLVHAGIAKPRG